MQSPFRIVTQLSTRRRQPDIRETQVGGAMERTVLPRAVQVADPGDSCSKTLRTNISETVLVLLMNITHLDI